MAAFYKKLNGVTPFRIPEVYYLCFLLNITGDDKPKIFYLLNFSFFIFHSSFFIL